MKAKLKNRNIFLNYDVVTKKLGKIIPKLITLRLLHMYVLTPLASMEKGLTIKRMGGTQRPTAIVQEATGLLPKKGDRRLHCSFIFPTS